MHVSVEVKLKQPVSSLTVSGADTLTARVTSAPENNKANAEVIALLAKHYKVPKSTIMLIRGAKSKTKTFEL
jgi:uncharacterized protein YggU (UPF0235/DUF167 family)